MKLEHRRRLIISCAMLLAFSGLFIYSVMIEPAMLVVQRQTVKVPHWAPGLNHLKVAVLSDLHVGALHITLEKLHTIIAEVNQEQPDIVFLLGDYVTGHGGRTSLKPEAFVHELAALKAKYGVYSVLGNHDWWYDGEDVRRGLEKAGIVVLENDAAEVKVKGESLWVSGLADLWTRKPDIKLAMLNVPSTDSCVMLMHNPDMLPEVPGTVSLSLAGHTHGGQVAVPFLGPVIVPSRLGAHFARGLIVQEDKHYFVTSGIGTSILPVRFGVPPEICILELCSH